MPSFTRERDLLPCHAQAASRDVNCRRAFRVGVDEPRFRLILIHSFTQAQWKAGSGVMYSSEPMTRPRAPTLVRNVPLTPKAMRDRIELTLKQARAPCAQEPGKVERLQAE